MEPFNHTDGVTDQYANMDILCLCVRFVDISNTKQCIIVIYTLWQVCSLMVNIVMQGLKQSLAMSKSIVSLIVPLYTLDPLKGV